MNYQQIKDRKAEIRAELADMQGVLTKENRGMTDDERAKADKLQLEWKDLERSARSIEIMNSQAPQRQEVKRSAAAAFDEIIRGLASNQGMPKEYRSFSNARSNVYVMPYTRMQRDGEVIQNTSTVAPTIPVTIKEVIDALEPATVIGQLGLNIQSGIQGTWNSPVVGGGTADWVGENDKSALTKIDMTKITPTPHRLPVHVKVSNQAIWQSAGVALDIVKNRMTKILSNKLNQTMLSDKSLGAYAPDGPFVNVPSANIIAVTGKAATITPQNVYDLRSAVNSQNVQIQAPAFLLNWKTYAALRTISLDKGSGRFLLDAETNTMDGVKVIPTPYVADGVIYYGDFAYEMLGQFDGMTMSVDSQSAAVADQDVTEIVINSRWDMKSIFSEAFGKITFATA